VKVINRDATDECLLEGTQTRYVNSITVVQGSVATGRFSDKHRPGIHHLCQPMHLSAVCSGFPSVPVHPEKPMEGGLIILLIKHSLDQGAINPSHSTES
jgi:hypothetical protein